MKTSEQIILDLGGIEVAFTAEGGKRLAIFIRWETKVNVQKRPAARLIMLQTFTPKVTDEIVRTLLRYCGYEMAALTKKERLERERFTDLKDIAIMRTPRGKGITLFLGRDRGETEINRLRIRLTMPQLTKVCRGIAPHLGWDLTE